MEKVKFSKKNLSRINRRELLKNSGIIAGASLFSSISGIAIAKPNKKLHDVEENNIIVIEKNINKNTIFVNYNENANGMSKKALGIASMSFSHANRYNLDKIEELALLISNNYGLTRKNILLLQGSSEGIRASINFFAFNSKKTQLIIPELTYEDAEEYANYYGIKVTKVPMKKNWVVDLNLLKKVTNDSSSNLKLVYIVNPNNPTGGIIDSLLLENWIKSKPTNTIFLVDEAYGEFVTDKKYKSVNNLIKDGYDNVILLKTFSKIYAMAGMRVGFLLAHHNLVKEITKFVSGEKLNYPAVEAAKISFLDKEHVIRSKELNSQAKIIILKIFDKFNINYVKPEGNFVFMKIPNISLDEFQTKMKQFNIIIGRAFPPATNWCRISLGTIEEMKIVVNAINYFASRKMI